MEEVKYPCKVPHRVIVTAECDEHVLAEVLTAFELVEPLAPSHSSAGGKYRAFGFVAQIKSYDELCVLDKILRTVNGVKMVL